MEADPGQRLARSADASRHRRRLARSRTARRPSRPSSSNARLLRSAQRSESCMARSISERSAGSFRHSSSCIDDVGAEQRLDFNRPLRRQREHRAVEMRAECHGVLVELAKLRQRHHLEAAGIGQDRAVPVHEFVQPAELGDALGTRPQHQMIGVAEQDLGAGCTDVLRRQPLHRRLGADRHEGRRLHAAMRRLKLAAPCRAVGLLELKRQTSSGGM